MKIFSSSDFIKAVFLCVALVLPILIGIQLDRLYEGIFVTMGVMLVSPNDYGANLRLKVISITLGTLLAMTVTAISDYISPSYWIFFPVLAGLIFSISYISIFGFRASLISFTGLFALVLSFVDFGNTGIPAFGHILLIGLGGMVFLLFVLLYQLFYPRSQTDEWLEETFKLTGDYIKVRGELVLPGAKRKKLGRTLLLLQTQLSENHEKLRETLISNRRHSGKSDFQTRRLMVFGLLVDILENAMANPVNYNKVDEILASEPEKVKEFSELLFEMSRHLHYLAENFRNPKKLEGSRMTDSLLERISRDVDEFCSRDKNPLSENNILLRNFLKYQITQADKLRQIDQILKSADSRAIRNFQKTDYNKFRTPSDFNLRLILDNFNFGSDIFRHSLRITAVTLVGYLIGAFFGLVNFYWILLTVIVIMRPNYGLTKKRSKERTYGTLIGGIIAVIIVYLVHNETIFAILSVLSLVVFFTMMQRNYKLAAVFITLNVVFVFALLEPDVYNLIQYRLLDTVIGAGLATLGNLFLWPSWEIRNIDKSFIKAFEANSEYLREVAAYYNRGGEPSLSYKLARKEAYLAGSGVSSAFQRMAQEPKSQHIHLEAVYSLTVLNHQFLSALASLNTYIIHNPTTPASENFNRIVDYICENLKLAADLLEGNEDSDKKILSQESILQHTYGLDFWTSLQMNPLRSARKTEEAFLVYEQLKWLLDVSERMVKEVRKKENLDRTLAAILE